VHIRYINGTEDGSLDLGLVHENNGKYICTVENGIRDRAGKYLYRQGEITVKITTDKVYLTYIHYIFSTFIFYTSFQTRLYLFVIALCYNTTKGNRTACHIRSSY
jgi:hypothetical protein